MDRKLTLGALCALGTVGAVAATPPALAQAVCSAPHSSPVLARGGSIRTLAPGAGWLQASILGQRSTEFFSPSGDRRPFLADGRVQTASLYLTGAIGVARGVDAWVQLPVHHLEYEDQGGRRDRTGVGDVRLSLRVSPELVGARGVPLAVRAGVKLPGSEFPVDATIIPLTEGQRDWEVSVESGRAFQRVPLYVLGWAGYRWRTENEAVSRKPGDERFAHLAIGGPLSTLRWELASEYLWGGVPEHLGLDVPTARRRLIQISPTIGHRAGPGELELTGIVPVAGRNFPAGPAISVGYRLTWGAE